MKLDMGQVIQALIVGVTMGILAASINTYLEVKLLRHDVNRLEDIIDNLVDEASKKP